MSGLAMSTSHIEDVNAGSQQTCLAQGRHVLYGCCCTPTIINDKKLGRDAGIL